MKSAAAAAGGVPDSLIQHFDAFLRGLVQQRTTASPRASPAANLAHDRLDAQATVQSGQLMRVNHTGEVCAQALYIGQAATAKSATQCECLQTAADDELDHLAWCRDRLNELGARPSRLNPVWYTGAYLIGALSGLLGDRWSLGFLLETERQVIVHLESHLLRLPQTDVASHAILTQMKDDEAKHAATAARQGAIELPAIVKRIMRVQAKVMTTLARVI
ncbi:MAG: 2-polyprenyl-3-methyl-6-methoxy-1,4-benzoquinone monooxygenase [Gammaproteobacteria bacterium]|nr:2-polyprenyl-3-methyl-6-methoxy-1,4-benzoquinone monooxygenase [Gammaproteobacteria bacterium]